MHITQEGTGAALEQVQTPVGAHPEPAAVVLQHGAHRIVAEPPGPYRTLPEVLEAGATAGQAVEPAVLSPHPERPLRVLGDGAYLVLAQAARAYSPSIPMSERGFVEARGALPDASGDRHLAAL